MTPTLADPSMLLAHATGSSESLPLSWGWREASTQSDLITHPSSQWPYLHTTKENTLADTKSTSLGPEKAETSADSKLHNSRGEVSLEGSRAYSARLDFADFAKSGWSSDQNTPMRHNKSALRSGEAMLGS